jgi:hypothetical protein
MTVRGKEMPRKGFSSITINNQTKEALMDAADQKSLSVPETVIFLIKFAKEQGALA